MAALQSFVQDKTGGAPQGGMATGALPPGHPPLGVEPPSAAPPAASGLPSGHPPVAGAGQTLKFEAPETWKSTPPRSAMRRAQYVLPRAAADSDDGELVVFYFGPGDGGTVAANLERWRAQFTDDAGQPLGADAGSETTFQANSLTVTMLDVTGRYAPGAMPGMEEVGPRENQRMLAAVVQTPGGPWFFKATGPHATIGAQREALRKMLENVKFE
ncbi:MAG: hypothetical protein U1D55_03610 [Phycisphaerae bacterium]